MRHARILALTLPITLALAAGCPTEEEEELGPSPLVLNEFMAANASTFEDDTGAFPDWIEIFNRGTSDVSLAGYAISDSLGQPLKHLISDASLVVPAAGYVVLFADGDVDQGSDHLSFRLTVDGEDLLLSGVEIPPFLRGEDCWCGC